MNQSRAKVISLGAGSFGTCLTAHLARQSWDCLAWDRNSEVIRSINNDGRNSQYLSEFDLPSNIRAADELRDQDFKDARMIMLAVPAQALRTVLAEQVKGRVGEHHLIVCVCKGIEIGTQKLPSEIFRDVLGEQVSRRLVYLSGPSFAAEVMAGQPTGVSVASHIPKLAKEVQAFFHAPHFRAYTSYDPVGLEVSGAVKNVIAIAAGACAGLGYKNNSRAALITRGLAEITRIGVAMGADPITFTGLGGVGDLFLTCGSTSSRNFSVGYYMGQGDTLETALEKIGSTAEGVHTAKAAHKLAQQLGTAAPITEAVHSVLYEGTLIKTAVDGLLGRDPKDEIAN